MIREINIDRLYFLDGEDVQKLVAIHDRLSDESRPLCGDERRDLHLKMGLILNNLVEDTES